VSVETASLELPALVRLARGLLRDPHGAEDVVQDVLAKILLEWGRVSAADDMDAYVHRMVVNACTSFFRRASRRREFAHGPDTLPDRACADGTGTVDDADRLVGLLRRLPAKQRDVLVLRHYEKLRHYQNLPDAQIAAVLGTTEVTAGRTRTAAWPHCAGWSGSRTPSTRRDAPRRSPDRAGTDRDEHARTARTALLVDGAHAGARRTRRRRVLTRSAAAAVCLAALLPVGLSVVGRMSPAGQDVTGVHRAPDLRSAAAFAAPSAQGPDPAGSTGSSARTDTGVPSLGAQVSAATGALLLERSASGEVVVPDDALLSAGDLGVAPLAVARDDPGAAATETTVLELCTEPGPGDDRAAGGRTVQWSGPAVHQEVWSFGTAVRVFAAQGAREQLGHLRRAVGVCTGSVGWSREPVAGLPGDESLLTSVLIGEPGQAERNAKAVGVVRVGRVTVGVDVTVPGGVGTDERARRALAVERARTLLVRARERVARLAEAAGNDPTLR